MNLNENYLVEEFDSNSMKLTTIRKIQLFGVNI